MLGQHLSTNHHVCLLGLRARPLTGNLASTLGLTVLAVRLCHAHTVNTAVQRGHGRDGEVAARALSAVLAPLTAAHRTRRDTQSVPDTGTDTVSRYRTHTWTQPVGTGHIRGHSQSVPDTYADTASRYRTHTWTQSIGTGHIRGRSQSVPDTYADTVS